MLRPVSLALIVSIAACATAPSEEDSRDDSFLASGKADTGGVVEGSPEAVGVLRVANEVSLEALVAAPPDGVGLTQRLADNIGAIRLGDDGLPGTADDGKLTTLAQLDAVPFVGPIAFKHMLDYARAQGWIVAHASVDTAPPTLRGVTFSPPTIDVSNGPQQVTVSLDIADDLSGVDSVMLWINNRVGGPATFNPATNRWEAQFTIANWIMAAYGISSFEATDHAWNVATCTSSSMCGAVPLYSTTFQLSNNSGHVDEMAPTATAESVSQTTIDVSQATPVQTFTIATSDDVGTTGVDLYVSPEADYAPLHVVAAPTQTAGTFAATVTMPSWSEPGKWHINQIDMQDAAGNFTGTVPTGPTGEFTVVNPGAYSMSPPMLLGATFSPISADVTNAAQTVVLSLHFAADISGIADVYVTLNIGNQYKTIHVGNPVVVVTDTLQIPIVVPRYMPPGSLKLFAMNMTDGHGRQTWTDANNPTMAGVDIRTATVEVRDGN